MASINVGSTTKAGAINNSTGYPVGTTVLTVNSFTGAVATGNWMTIAGDNTPYQISAHTESGGNTVQITLGRGLLNAVANAAVVTTYVAGTVTNGPYTGSLSTTPVPWGKEITMSGVTVAPQVGQLITFGTTLTDPTYTIEDVDSTSGITLDRPLEVTIANGAAINFGPTGNYNMAFHRNALALVVRPLAMPMPGSGAISAVVNHNGLSMRATITYQGRDQGHLVTLDMLCGIALLDANLGAVMLG